MAVILAAGELIARQGSPVLLILPLVVYDLGGDAVQVKSTITLTAQASEEKQGSLGVPRRLVLNVGFALANAIVTRGISHGDLLSGRRPVLRGSGQTALLCCPWRHCWC